MPSMNPMETGRRLAIAELSVDLTSLGRVHLRASPVRSTTNMYSLGALGLMFADM